MICDLEFALADSTGPSLFQALSVSQSQPFIVGLIHSYRYGLMHFILQGLSRGQKFMSTLQTCGCI